MSLGGIRPSSSVVPALNDQTEFNPFTVFISVFTERNLTGGVGQQAHLSFLIQH